MATVGRPTYTFRAPNYASARKPTATVGKHSLWLREAALEDHLVTCPVNGEDDFRLVGAYFHFLPEPGDEIVDRTGSELGVVAPHMLQQIVPADNIVPVFEQVEEDFKFFVG